MQHLFKPNRQTLSALGSRVAAAFKTYIVRIAMLGLPLASLAQNVPVSNADNNHRPYSLQPDPLHYLWLAGVLVVFIGIFYFVLYRAFLKSYTPDKSKHLFYVLTALTSLTTIAIFYTYVLEAAWFLNLRVVLFSILAFIWFAATVWAFRLETDPY